jgi:hypothetical protein
MLTLYHYFYVHANTTGENALLISGPFQSNGKSSNASNSNSSGNSQQQLQHSVTLCNAIGSALEVRQLDMCAPKYAAMTQCHIVVADERVVYVWQYKTPHAHYSSSSTTDTSAGNYTIHTFCYCKQIALLSM